MPPGSRRLVALGGLLIASLSLPQAGEQPDTPIADPIPADPVMSRTGLVVKEVATFPMSEPVPAPVDRRLMRRARINHLGEIPDGSRRLYVPDLNGKLYMLRDSTPEVYLDVRSTIGANFFSGRGLGSGFGFVSFHPEFKSNGKFYTAHTEAFDALTSKTPELTSPPNAVVHGVITEWTAADPRANVFNGTHREVLRLGFATFIHGVQQIDFNPTAKAGVADYGLLYVAVGDGGTGVRTTDPQNLTVPHGKILRIDPSGTTSGNGRYGIPLSNPFVRRENALAEIFAYGMRDPHRFSWDPSGQHRMFLGHIGERDIEAIYDVRAGDNLGWSEREGPFVFNREDVCNLFPLPNDDAARGYTYPVAAYDHDPPPGYPCNADVGHAASGGFVYRGNTIRDLQGNYIFADLVDGRLMFTDATAMRRGGALATIHELALFDESGREVTTPILVNDKRVDLRIGRDAVGELYLITKADGKVRKVIGTRTVGSAVHPSTAQHLVARYDFEHPLGDNAAIEVDQGPSRTDITLINGKGAMRVSDGAYRGSVHSIQLTQRSANGNDAWKAGIYSSDGVRSLGAFNAVSGATVMGWFKMTGENPSPNSNTAEPNDRYGAVGLAGILTGDSNGHSVRALLELITVDGSLRLVTLGRRLDGGPSQTFAASQDWQTLLPPNTWVFLAATFDYRNGSMALYRDGKAISGSYVVSGDPWNVAAGGPHTSSATDPRGIKIGGSFPQNSREANPCNCRMDDLMFIARALTPLEVNQQYRRMTSP
jgi:hypothetical protein